MTIEEAVEKFHNWEEVVEAYRKGEITSSQLLDLMDYFNVR